MYKFLFVIALVLVGCCSKWEMNDTDRRADHMVLDFAATMKSRGLHVVGLGGGLEHSTGKHKTFKIVFGIREIDSIEAARQLYVMTLSDFIDFINNREDIAEHLANSPCTIKNVEVSIIFENSGPGELVYIFNCDDRLCYFARNENINNLKDTKILEESFEEAKKLSSL